MNQSISAFQLINSRPIAALNVTVDQYLHTATGAKHLHLRSDSDENAFMVAFRTVPMDDTGVAHILEHTTLCGSRKYPVRDPFFMMIRRSLNTFMNALTSSDWTAYPFATRNLKDFDNLLDVYLDAVFFPNLNPLDFAQEGHRLALVNPDDDKSPLEIRGVVYNEMKGAMSAPVSILWQKLSKHLFPTTTYHYNSGGEPEAIPSLSYEQLVAFHRRHYHPSNAIFMTFGNIDAHRHHARLAEVLAQFRDPIDAAHIDLEQRYAAPLVVEERYPLPEGEPTEQATHVVVGWLLGDSADLMASMEAELLGAVLLDNSSSPLQQALETTELGRSPSPLCGVDSSQREICFVCGVEGAEPAQSDAVEQLILDTLRKVADEGVPLADVESCLHQLELQQREISGDSYPFGLQLMLGALAAANHGADAAAALDLEPVLEELRRRIANPDYIPSLCRALLLDNPHRVRLTLKPDTQLEQQRDAELQTKLQQLAQSLDETGRAQIRQLGQDLDRRQAQEDDPSILPGLTLADVPTLISHPSAQMVGEAPRQVTTYGAGTNGILYQLAVSELPKLSDKELLLLPMLTRLLPELGYADRDYMQAQRDQAAVTGGLGLSAQMRGGADNPNAVRGYLITSSKALYRHRETLTDLMEANLVQARFDETARLRELVAQMRARTDARITGSGHTLAMQAASQGYSALNRFQQNSSGLDGIEALRTLDQALNDKSSLAAFAGELAQLHQRLMAQPRTWVAIGEGEILTEQALALTARTYQGSTRESFSLPTPKSLATHQLWVVNTQVNYCARAFPSVPLDHPDAAVLTVLAGVLRNLYLHPAIRERGGAYGGGATQDNNNAVFRFYSYRDPRLAETLTDFDRSVQQLVAEGVDRRHLDEAILGVISSVDKTGSPAGEARHAYSNMLFGRTPEILDRFRARTLAVCPQDLVRVAATYLQDQPASTAVLTGAGNLGMAESLGLVARKLA